ncbi:uncharacterized protein LOC125825176 [Solanum verrucosum]|uniref:uncharacterized protein LOC125825176 n=1 Tax=Solanum verrucosum TaxID=315347 RepID=UPI0020D11077|nr:uncharacterized protein LOC125825176 [Solanum verrucosum]
MVTELKVRDVAISRPTNMTSCIQKPEPGGRFELKQSMVQILHTNWQFTGLSHEDPTTHIQNFLKISDTYTPTGVNKYYVRLTLFPFSLLGEAKRWLNSEPANSITTWDDLVQKFLIRFFPYGKTAKLRGDILSFRQKSGGQALEKTYAELFTLLNRISQGNSEWNRGRMKHVVQKTAGMLEVDAMTALTAQISTMQNMMSTHFSNMALGQQHVQVNIVQQPPSWCEISGGSDHCAENQGQGQNHYRPQDNANGYQPQAQRERPKQQSKNMSVKEMLKKIMVDQAQLAANVRNNQLATQNLEKQFGQFTSAQNSRPQGGLPGNTDPNPKQVNAVSTCSGLQLEELTPKKRNTEVINTETEPKEGELKENEVVSLEESVQPIVRPPPPFPQKFKKQKEDECFGKFFSLLKQVHINLPLVDVLQGIYPDLGSFTVQITIGESIHARGLCDLGASINLMPTSLYKKLGLGSPKPTTIILQLADRYVARPEGVVKDVLVQVGSLIFPVDFVVLNFEPDPEIPFILGRPFLATGRAMIDVAVGQLTMRAHDKVEVFDVYTALKLSVVYEELSVITVIDLEA